MPSITLALSTVVAAPCARVWSALADPERARERRPGAVAVLPPAPGALQPGRALRLRCLLAAVPVLLEERALEVVPEVRLHSTLRVGLFHCEETLTLKPDAGGERTRVGLRIVTPSETALVGESLDRFGVRRFAALLAAGSLDALRHLCEGAPAVVRTDPLDPPPHELA